MKVVSYFQEVGNVCIWMISKNWHIKWGKLNKDILVNEQNKIFYIRKQAYIFGTREKGNSAYIIGTEGV